VALALVAVDRRDGGPPEVVLAMVARARSLRATRSRRKTVVAVEGAGGDELLDRLCHTAVATFAGSTVLVRTEGAEACRH